MAKEKTPRTYSFTASQEGLSSALSRVIGAVSKRTTLPILSHVRMDVFLRGAVGFTATDLDLRAFAECRASVPGAGGEVCIPADILKGALAAMAGEISATVDGVKLILEGDGRRFEIACLSTEEFPSPSLHWQSPSLHWQSPCLQLDPVRLPRLLKAVAHASSQDESKYNLCGIYLCSDQGRLTAVASDGHRLSLAGVGLLGGEDLGEGFILPARSVRILSGAVSGISIARGTPGKNDNQVLFDASDLELSVRLIEGQFPDYRRVIPSEDGRDFLVVDSAALAEAIEACAVVTGEDKGKCVRLECPEDALGESLTVSALGPCGVATATVPCQGGTGFKTAANSRYLLQALKALGGEVFIKFGDTLGPLLLSPVDHVEEGIGWDERLEVVMPYRI